MNGATLLQVVRILGLVAILSIVGLVVLGFTGAQADATRTALASIATGTIGALAGIMAQPPRGS